jgi:hypothetical protein
MGWIAGSLGLDYLRVQDCRRKGRSYALLFDTEYGNEDAGAWDSPKRHENDDENASTLNLSETGDEDASTSNWTKRREACMSVTNTLRRRFLQAEPDDSAQSLSIPRKPLRLW